MRDLIVFGEDFGGLPSSTQHLVTRLAKDRKILWVNSIGLRQPKLNQRDMARAFNKLLGRSKAGYQTPSQLTPNNITVVNVKTIPAPSSSIARTIARQMLVAQIKPVIEKLKLQSPILWSSLPTTADLCGHLNESAVVYYCGDDFSALAGVDHDVVAQHENKLVASADLILAASDKLCKKFPQRKTQLLPHGVDVSLFQTPVSRAPDLPQSNRPIAGFYGSLSNWLDYDLLTNLCEMKPDWDFVFIGPKEIHPCPLPKASNVYYLGKKAHAELPRYSQHWTVGLLPFKSNGQILACSPLKLMEYLAAGSRVISTEFPAVTPYRKEVSLAHNAKQFSEAMDRIVQNDQARPSTSLEQHSWDSRSQALSVLLEAL
ncbi:glycosyltransferase family protein [Vibrio sinaloensis]|uniref:glycosyltransferase family 1 protein n=1 Tax=Photobacterium sp. (strain ATCC 43367) TaxID=379097 RepID=UPI0035E8E5D0